MRARVRWPQANLFAVLVFSGLRFGDFALAQPVAFAVHLEDMDVVGQAIENGTCEAFCAEDLGPFIERQVGCDDDGATFPLCQGSCPLLYFSLFFRWAG